MLTEDIKYTPPHPIFPTTPHIMQFRHECGYVYVYVVYMCMYTSLIFLHIFSAIELKLQISMTNNRNDEGEMKKGRNIL